ncbi:tripartite motif-containing 45 isoform X2, putative [Babesia ovata]|uniref:Tripartite motif-containing 45 isoform X2, putative n=1 Tax=Babesia ovata TaxID=189622 RepID=A0A2H6KCJ4_9APIC|nr:tripartite motif-containing 45 isoform X2, putative [Babesia ovata]GBE60679.1 tripartite motif-containing 45 isoform X2, putative [Babesia ovata]
MDMPGQGSEVCLQWYEAWLTSIATIESPRSPAWDDNLPHYARLQNAGSLNEIAIEHYHALHKGDLSLEELSQHIGQIGDVLSQVDLRKLATQPKSRSRQMLTPFFDCADISQALQECHRQDSFAYVFLLVRLLYEILLYTKSSAVRVFCFYQIVRNAKVLRILFGLVTREVSLKGTEGYVEGVTPSTVDALNTIGQLPRRFSFNVMDNILKQMLTSKDINLRVCGLELLKLCPRIVACNPQLLGELRDTLVGPVEELASKAAVSLVSVLEYVPEAIAQIFLTCSHEHALAVEFSPQRIQSFCCVALGCRQQPLYKTAFRMCWNIWIHVDTCREERQTSDTLMVRESHFYLMLTSTILCLGHPELEMRQRRRLESLIYDQKERDCGMEVALCLNLLYRHNGDTKELTKLTKAKIKGTNSIKDMNILLCSMHIRQFEETKNPNAFLNALAVFEDLVVSDPANIKLLYELKNAFKLLKTNYSEYMIRMLRAAASQYAALTGELSYLQSVVIRTMGNIVKMCYVVEPQKLAKMMPEIKEIVELNDLRYLFKPLLSADDFGPVDDGLTATQVNLWVGTLYDLTYIKPPKVQNFVTIPVSIDLLSGKLGNTSETSPVRVAVITKKDSFNSSVLNEHVRALISSAFARISSGSVLKLIIDLALRLGLYREAANCLKQLELWTNDTLLWFNAFLLYANAEVEADEIKAVQLRVQGLDALETYSHQCTSWAMRHSRNEVMAPELNYALPSLVTHAWCVLRLVFQVAVGHLRLLFRETPHDCSALTSVFVGLFGHFKSLRWAFRNVCCETTNILQVYEGLCILLYAICTAEPLPEVKKEDIASQNPEETQPTRDPDEALRCYITNIFAEDDIHMPETFAIVNLIDPAIRAQLYTAPAIMAAHKGLIGAVTKQSSDSNADKAESVVPQVMPTHASQLSLESILNEFVLFSRVRTNKEKNHMKKAVASDDHNVIAAAQCEVFFSYLSRDMEPLMALQPLAKMCDAQNRSTKTVQDLLNAISTLQLPMPVGVIKTFPLPFAALTALVEYEKRSGDGPAAIHIQGSMRNCACRVPWIKIKLEVLNGRTSSSVLFRRRFKMHRNVIDKYVHLYLELQDVDALSFSCLPLNSGGYPCGVPTHFRPTSREIST